jgi:phosphoribosyl 1,2-cyclic phosphodiesterase
LYIEAGGVRLLVDAGISARKLGQGLDALQVPPGQLDALVITHEHQDHTRGLERFARLHPHIPILATAGTAEACRALGVEHVEACLRDGEPLNLGNLDLTPFATSHDAREPVGLRLDAGSISLGLCTDLGCTPFSVREALEGVHVLVLEANYDQEMLARGSYPGFLKRRVGGDLGHLSNLQARELLRRLLHPELGAVILAHLSEKNNRPEVALTAVGQALWEQEGILLGAFPHREPSELLHFSRPPGAQRPLCHTPKASLWRSPGEALFATG